MAKLSVSETPLYDCSERPQFGLRSKLALGHNEHDSPEMQSRSKLNGQLSKHVAVIGAGWAGCASACALAEAGHKVTLFEAARTLGGRARAVTVHDHTLDNGQHIMLGAYSACLGLMKKLGVDHHQALMRLPLQMVYPHDSGMQFIAPRLPAPLHLAWALLRAQGLNSQDKMALARFSTTARWMDWQLNVDCSVSELLDRFDQTQRLQELMWKPLCLAALNTPAERASAQVFLAVLRDSLGAKRNASDMLIPRCDLSALIPQAAARFLEQRACKVHIGTRIANLEQVSDSSAPGWRLHFAQERDDEHQIYDAIVVATDVEQARHLLQNATLSDSSPRPEIAQGFEYEAITTCYLQYDQQLRLPRPFFALKDQADKAYWGQFVFDRGQLQKQHAGMLAVIISASQAASQWDKDSLKSALCTQLAEQLRMPELIHANWFQIITEKRATFSCQPHLQRPSNATTIPNLVLAGDYTACDYPATLEAAVRSGQLAAQHILKLG